MLVNLYADLAELPLDGTSDNDGNDERYIEGLCRGIGMCCSPEVHVPLYLH